MGDVFPYPHSLLLSISRIESGQFGSTLLNSVVSLDSIKK